MGARRPIPLLSMKVTTKIGTWNVRTIYETSKAAQVQTKCVVITSRCLVSVKEDRMELVA